MNMKTLKKLLLMTLISIVFNSCAGQENLNDLNFMIGTWKIENKETYESWEKINDSKFEGESYKIIQGQKQTIETLSIKVKENKIIYEATVPNQNNGKAISFELNTTNKEIISFENLNHDFPKRIQYKVINDSKILVNVFGNNNQGFSYYQVKQ